MSDQNRDKVISKKLARFLRHGALKEGLNISPDGFIKLQEVLNHKRFEGLSVDDIRRVVENNKQRFTLVDDDNVLKIKANKRHCITWMNITFLSGKKKDIVISKRLSWFLRHAALKEGLNISSDGFVNLQELLNHKKFEGILVDDVKRVVENNNKQRFTLVDDNNTLKIKANQGHSLTLVNQLSLKELTSYSGYIIHGTYLNYWENIQKEGLSRMKRNHIHFSKGLPDDKQVISGIRKDCDLYIYIDFPLAVKDNIKFYESENSVILSPGDSRGYIEPKYFLKVCTSNGNIIFPLQKQ